MFQIDIASVNSLLSQWIILEVYDTIFSIFTIYWEIRFEKPDLNKFKCLQLAYNAIERGHCYQVILNAADEILVDAFINKKIKYTQIPLGIEKILNMYEKIELNSINEILEFDKEVKEKTIKFVNDCH